MMESLCITAHLAGAIALPGGSVGIDALLMAAVALRDQLPPPPPFMDIGIPIEREPGGRFHLASFSEQSFEDYELRWVNRRFPTEIAQTPMGSLKIRRVNLAGGPSKSYRLPLETGHLVGDCMRWWCVGELAAIENILELVGYVGKKRGMGLGRVREWGVDPCEVWPGFPVVRDGKPLRTLPADWPGLVDPAVGYRVLSPPYWEHTREELCAVIE